MRIAYDKESHGVFMRLQPGEYVESEEITPGIVVDFDAVGEPIAIEFEDVRGFMDEKALERITQPHIRKGADLREYRERLGMTQDELAEKLDIPRNTIARWERDELAIEKSRLLELALAALLRSARDDSARSEAWADHALKHGPTNRLTATRKARPPREVRASASRSGRFAHFGKKHPKATDRGSPPKRKKK